MPVLWSAGLLLSVLFQSGNPAFFSSGIFNDRERLQIGKEADDIQGRIQVYRNVSIRIQKTLQKAVSQGDFQDVPDQLKLWISLLTGSIEDIETHLNPGKKKSKALIKYEIQIRKSINEARDYKIKAPADQQDAFNDCIAGAENIRKKMVEILFQPDLENR